MTENSTSLFLEYLHLCLNIAQLSSDTEKNSRKKLLCGSCKRRKIPLVACVIQEGLLRINKFSYSGYRK